MLFFRIKCEIPLEAVLLYNTLYINSKWKNYLKKKNENKKEERSEQQMYLISSPIL